jgi:CDP-glucose 4,6-dehydratase
MGRRPRSVENLVISRDFWRGRKVFMTGHTGFKGSWTSLLLSCLGARVYGYALPPEREIDLFRVAGVEQDIEHQIGDIRNFSSLRRAIEDSKPEIVIHMAAQALVRPSYEDPVGTYATNVMGTVHVLEAVRQGPHGVGAVVVVTSDKCYENKGSRSNFREEDPLGGDDPYSSSKGCAELATNAYRRSFFSNGRTDLASVRAGNVIGGGDWAVDRLIPDVMRAFLSGAVAEIRNPHAVRPWQHVLDPVVAYLQLAERLISDRGKFAEAWNFGPESGGVSVEDILTRVARMWGEGARWKVVEGGRLPESAYLGLDCGKAARRLGWRPAFDLDEALQLTVDWYRLYGEGANMRDVTLSQIERFLEGAKPFRHQAR